MPLSEQDKTHYLANIMLVAFADRSVSPQEAAAIEEIRKSIDAKKSTLTAAQRLAEGGSYSLQAPGSFAHQVLNLEDMLVVGLADSSLNDRETELISSYCQSIGVYQDQLDKITADASRRCSVQEDTVTCPNCSAVAQAQARFCPGCGSPLAGTEQASVKIDFDVPTEGYAIEFCESTAGGFASALSVATATGRMQTAVRLKKTWYLVPYPRNRFVDMLPLVSELSGIRNRRIYLDGAELEWQEVFGFMWCAAQRAQSYRPIEYCFGKDENRLNPWGCKQSRMDWTDWAQWFSYGSWQKAGLLRNGVMFVFDKERIRHELATALHRFRFCPHLRPTLIEAVLRHFPDQAEVAPDGPWKYNHSYDAAPGTIKITEREGSGSFAYTNEYHADGVRPHGHVLLADIMKKAFKDCGVTDVTQGNLLT